MLISVCTVLAEGEDSLEALLTSVAAQQATLELEVVVVDRGIRALPGVLADWLPRLPRLAVVRCQGLDELAAWRRAVAVATGELLRFIPPALTLPPEALQRALATLLPNPQCLGIYGDLDGYSRVVPLGQPVPLDTLLLRRAALDHGCVLIQEPVDGRLACRPAAAQPGSLTYLPAVLAAAPRAGAVIGAPTAAVPAGSPAGAGSLERYAAAVVESWQPPVSPTPDVTVVVRTHGEPREWLAAAVQSALDQADVRVEVIVVDDLSPLPVAPFADRRCDGHGPGTMGGQPLRQPLQRQAARALLPPPGGYRPAGQPIFKRCPTAGREFDAPWRRTPELGPPACPGAWHLIRS